MLNLERLHRLYDFLLSPDLSPDGWDYSQWGNLTKEQAPGCGFVGCAIGWAIQIFDELDPKAHFGEVGLLDENYLTSFFGLTDYEFGELFVKGHPHYDGLPLRNISRRRVAETIELFVDDASDSEVS